jgi:hypothetical protein
MSSVLLLLATGTARDISTRRSAELIVYNSIGSSTIGVRTGKILNVYSDSLPPGQEVARHCAMLGLRASHHLISNEPCLVKTGDKSVLITKYMDSGILKRSKPDILIFAGNRPAPGNIVQPVEKPNAVIVASGTYSGGRFSRMIRLMNADTVHFTVKDGAFRIKL